MIAKEGRIILVPLLLVTFPIGVYAHATNNNILIILYSILGLLLILFVKGSRLFMVLLLFFGFLSDIYIKLSFVYLIYNFI